MFFVPDYKLGFIHIPRTGGSWRRELCRRNKLEIYAVYKEMHRPLIKDIRFKDYLIVGFIRHPETWYPTFYNMWHHLADSPRYYWPELSSGATIAKESDSFYDFCINLLIKEPGFYSKYCDIMLRDVNKICYFEKLKEEFEKLIPGLNDIGPICVWKKEKYTWDESLKKEILKHESILKYYEM